MFANNLDRKGKYRKGKTWSFVLTVWGIGFTGVSGWTHGQDTNTEDGTLEEIVVTGTFIRGAEAVGSPVQNIDQQTVADSGKSTLADYLREIPSNFAGGVGMSDEVQSGQDAGAGQANLAGGQGVNLRGLGALSTLVLVNGRRAPASGQFGDFVDVSNIPLAAIERVEVLQDGASALYGSDAVGGVMNFVLRRRLEGLAETSIKYGNSSLGGGDEITFSQLFGNEWDSGGFVVGVEYYGRDHLKATDHDYYKNGSDFSAFGGVNWPLYTAHFGSRANIYLGDQGGSPSSPVGATVPVGANDSLTAADLIPVTDGIGNTHNVYEQMDLLPEVERTSYFGAFDWDLSNTVSVYGDLRYTDRESNYDLGYMVSFDAFGVSPFSPYYITGITPPLINTTGATASFIPFGLVIDEAVETRESSVESTGMQLGISFDVAGDWVIDAAYSFGQDDQRRYGYQLANVPLSGTINRFNCALMGVNPSTPLPPAPALPAYVYDCAAANLQAFNPWSTEPVSAAQINEITGFEDLRFDSKVSQFSVKADGSLFSLPAGEVKMAVGLDYREEEMEGFLDWNTGSLTTRSGPYALTERDATSVFVEFAIPVADAVNLSVAGRYEEFSGTGDYDTFNPKIGIDWHVTDDLKLRASWGTSFHAPPMRFENDDPQPLPGGNAAFILPGSYQGPCDSTLVTFNGIIGTPGMAGENCSFTVLINSGGAGEGVLKPEEAETFSLGLDWQSSSIEGLSAHLNYYNIEIEDRIQRIQSGTLPGIVGELFATGTSPFASAVNIDPDDAAVQAIIDSAKFLGTFGPPIFNTAADVQMIVNATQINIATLETAGWDFGLNYAMPVGDIELEFFINGTLVTKYETEAAPGAGTEDQLGKYSSFGAPVKLRSRQGVSTTFGDIYASLSLNYVDDYECAVGSCIVPAPGTGAPTANTSAVPIDSWLTTDLALRWDLSRFGGMADGMSLSFNANNVFDEEPPFLDGGSSSSDALPSAHDPNNHTITGRTVSVGLVKRW